MATPSQKITDVPPSSDERMAQILAIINERPEYNMQEFAEQCRAFTNRTEV